MANYEQQRNYVKNKCTPLMVWKDTYERLRYLADQDGTSINALLQKILGVNDEN